MSNLQPPPTMAIDRIKALTDGVLAIVLTILVLGFEVPEHEFSESGVIGFLIKMREPLLAYTVSFGIVAAYWVQHAAIFRFLKVGNRPLVWMNFLFMLPLTLLPFLTDLRAEYHAEYRVTALYAIGNIFIGLTLLVMWRYAVSRKLTVSLPREVSVSMQRRILLGIGINALGAAVAPIDVHLSAVCFLALPVIYFRHTVVDRVSDGGE